MSRIPKGFKPTLNKQEGLKFIRQMRKRPIYGKVTNHIKVERLKFLDPTSEYTNFNIGGFKVLLDDEKEYFMNVPVNKSSCIINVLARNVQLSHAISKNNELEVIRLLNLGAAFEYENGEINNTEIKKYLSSRINKTSQLIEKIQKNKVTNKDIDEIGVENSILVNFIKDKKFLIEYACESHNEKLIEKLVDCGADATLVLKYAVQNNKNELVKKLISHGANVNLGLGFLPLRKKNPDFNLPLIEMLLKAGAKVRILPESDSWEGTNKLSYELIKSYFNKQNRQKVLKKIKDITLKTAPWLVNLGATTFLLTRLVNPIIGTISSVLLVGLEFSLKDLLSIIIFNQANLNTPKELDNVIKNYHQATGNVRRYVNNKEVNRVNFQAK